MRVFNSFFIISALFLLAFVFTGPAFCTGHVSADSGKVQIISTADGEPLETILSENNGLRRWNSLRTGLLSPNATLKIFAADGGADDQFGYSMAVSGDTLVVGAPVRSAVYIYVWNGTQWAQQAKLTTPGDIRFGASLAIQGDNLLVGAAWETITQPAQGSVYYFTRSGGVWTQQQRIIPAFVGAGHRFGTSIAMDGNTIIVGVPDTNNFGGVPYGSVDIFVRTGNTWVQQGDAMVSFGGLSNECEREFGRSVTIKGDTVAISCPRAGTSPPNPDPNHNHGAVYIYKRDGTGSWFAQLILRPADNKYNDYFGSGIAFAQDGSLIVGAKGAGPVGARTGAVYTFSGSDTNWVQAQKIFPSDMVVNGEFGNNLTVNGEQMMVSTVAGNTEPIFGRGFAYTFQRSGGAWTEAAKLFDPDAVPDDQFGISLAISGDRFFAGAANARVNSNNHQGQVYAFTAPSAIPDLQAVSDTGLYTTDNLTNSRNPGFDIRNLTVGSTVELLRNDVVVASAAVTTSTMTLHDNAPPANGQFLYTSRQIVGGQTGSAGSPLFVTYDTAVPVLTIRHDGPNAVNNQNSVNFRALMNEPGYGFEVADVSLAGSTANVSGATVEFYSNTDYINYDIKVRNILSDGVIMVTVPSGAIMDGAGNLNNGINIVDNTITYDTTPPVATVEQEPSQADPTNTLPIAYTVTFNEPVDRFGSGDGNITVQGSPAGVQFAVISTQGSGTTYTSTVTNVIGDNQAVIARVAQGGCIDLAGNRCAPSISTDNSVTLNNAILKVTIDQAASQPDPAPSLPINFSVVCSQLCSPPAPDDINLAGSTADVSQATITITGASPNFNVAIGNVTSTGEVRASVRAYSLFDTNNHPNAPSRSTDNTVTYAIPVSEISGQVRTSSGIYILNALVEATFQTAEKRYIRTTPLGYYRLKNVPHGNVTLKFTSKNYQTVTQNIFVTGDVTGLNPVLVRNSSLNLLAIGPEDELFR